MTRTITFRPEAGDTVAVARGSFLHSMKRPKFYWRMLLIILVAVGTGSAIILALGGPVTINALAFLVGIAICWLTVALVAIYLLIPFRSKRLFRQQRSLAHDFTLEWDEDGLAQRWAGGAQRTRWTEYHDWFEDDRVICFGLNEQLYHFAPKRVLAAEQCADLRALAAMIARPETKP